MSVKELLTPKQVANAIGASESSLKRWCDQGKLRTVRTAGGHRRIPISAVLEFLKVSGQQLLQPELLGLPPSLGRTERGLDSASDSLREGLIGNNELVCRRIVFDLYLAGHSIAEICDRVIQPSFVEIGNLWDCGIIEVYQERGACEITQRVISELRTTWSYTEPDAPMAMGGTLSGDEYRLPTAMVELTLRSAGWCATSLGTSLPVESLCIAIERNRPLLFWLSVSHIEDPNQFIASYPPLFEMASKVGTAVVLGGRALSESIRNNLQFSTYCDNFRQLERFAQTLRDAADRKNKRVAEAETGSGSFAIDAAKSTSTNAS